MGLELQLEFEDRLICCNFPSLPPELDIFGIILYSVLTFMATVSMLVFIEECIYIYRKVPANKKSVIIWVNGAAPVRLWIVCREDTDSMDIFHPFQGTDGDQIYCIFTWCFPLSPLLFQVIGAMSCLGMWIPRATMFTDMTSAW